MRTLYKGECKNTEEVIQELNDSGRSYYKVNATPTGWAITETDQEQIAFDQGREAVLNGGMSGEFRNRLLERIKETAERDGIEKVMEVKMYSRSFHDSFLFVVLLQFKTTEGCGTEYSVHVYNDTCPGFNHGQYTSDLEQARQLFKERGGYY